MSKYGEVVIFCHPLFVSLGHIHVFVRNHDPFAVVWKAIFATVESVTEKLINTVFSGAVTIDSVSAELNFSSNVNILCFLQPIQPRCSNRGAKFLQFVASVSQNWDCLTRQI